MRSRVALAGLLKSSRFRSPVSSGVNRRMLAWAGASMSVRSGCAVVHDSPPSLLVATIRKLPPGRDGWDIQVDRANVRLSSRAARLTNAALATSGPTEQFTDIAGRRYSHVIDPRTGMALTNRVIAHVIAPDAETADALSTALTVLARDRRAAVLARFGEVVASVIVE